MSRPNTPLSPDTPHLVSLVLHSKKALQHGEQLCSTAHELTRGTSQIAAELLALDAKAKWVTQGIIEQLKLAGSIAKSIEAQRGRLVEQAKQWDTARSFHTLNLDGILESLESQPVPPDFHQTSSASSIFGSQHSDDEENSEVTDTVVKSKPRARHDENDRSKWKSLRDFVHERGIEEATESMDNDRVTLDDILASTEEFPGILRESITTLQESLPLGEALPQMEGIFNTQDRVTTNMAKVLESLASHYEQMAAALKDKESGVQPSEDDLLEMNRDTDELPAIIAELEGNVVSIETSYGQLKAARDTLLARLNSLRDVVDKLDGLEEAMTSMLEQQQDTETNFEIHLASLQQHLTTLEHLFMTYTSYELSYNSLLVELDRRRRYRDTAEEIVRGMARQLDAMRDEEIRAREQFYELHGPHLPDDLCLCVANMPTKWEVGPALGETLEELPEVDDDLLAEATKRIDMANLKSGTESL